MADLSAYALAQAAQRAQIRADLAYALALRGGGVATAAAAAIAVLGTTVDRESPTVAAGPPTTLTLAHVPLSDACCVVWRGAGDGWPMTTAWTRVANVITLTNPRVDANESFQVSYRY